MIPSAPKTTSSGTKQPTLKTTKNLGFTQVRYDYHFIGFSSSSSSPEDESNSQHEHPTNVEGNMFWTSKGSYPHHHPSHPDHRAFPGISTSKNNETNDPPYKESGSSSHRKSKQTMQSTLQTKPSISVVEKFVGDEVIVVRGKILMTPFGACNLISMISLICTYLIYRSLENTITCHDFFSLQVVVHRNCSCPAAIMAPPVSDTGIIGLLDALHSRVSLGMGTVNSYVKFVNRYSEIHVNSCEYCSQRRRA